MLNVTDDAWFGLTPGPYQHFAQARLRAIEQGLPLVRAANTGISAVIDGLGRVTAQLPLGVEGVLDSPLPAPRPPTVYSRFGALAPALLWVVLLAFSILSKRRPRM
jgi:apolipoprotein N-acyltransferase